MIKLNKNEVCSYSANCPYNNGPSNFCNGAVQNRNKEFVCNLVSDTGVFTEGGFRSSLDETGQMKIILENK